MSMTRTDFDEIAAIVRFQKLQEDSPSLHALAVRLTLYFKKSNPTFDKGRFLRRCGFYQEG